MLVFETTIEWVKDFSQDIHERVVLDLNAYGIDVSDCIEFKRVIDRKARERRKMDRVIHTCPICGNYKREDCQFCPEHSREYFADITTFAFYDKYGTEWMHRR